MSAADLFRAAIRDDVAPTLVRRAFARSKLVFRRDGDETIQFVTFQSSKKSTREEVWFAVNLGVASELLLAGRADPSRSLVDCHWFERLSPDGNGDHWWRVVDAASAEASMAQCVALLEHTALPKLEQLSTNASLRDAWLSGHGQGLSRVQELLYLHRLVKAIGPGDRLDQVTAELELLAQTRHTPAVVAYLRRLERA